MTLDEMISDINYVVSKSQLATMELGNEDAKQLLHWLEDYQKVKEENEKMQSVIERLALALKILGG